MNNSGLIRQYVTLAGVLLVAVFILTQIDWPERGPSTPVAELASPSPDTVSEAPAGSSARAPASSPINTSDLRSGGVSRAPSPPVLETVDTGSRSAASSTPFQAATTTPFEAATSTGFNLDSQQAAAAPGDTFWSPDNAYSTVRSDLKISGRVLDGEGVPVDAIPLTLKLRQASAEAKRAFGNTQLSASTDVEGRYEFTNLVEGDYQLCTIAARGYEAVCQRSGAPQSSADFSLRGAPGGRVYGKVTDQDGNALPEVYVSATPGQSQRTTTDAEGRYELGMTVDDRVNYQLYFTRQDYSQRRLVVKGAEILTGKQLDAKLKKTQPGGVDVSGEIYDQTGKPVGGRMVVLNSPTISSPYPLRAVSDENGEFKIRDVRAGNDYGLSVVTGEGYMFDASAFGKLRLYQGMPPLRIELQSRGFASFAARVVSNAGQPVSGETFALYSGSTYVGRAVSDSGGEIRFEEVPVRQDGSPLRILGGSSAKYSFTGITLAEDEHQSGVQLVVDQGENQLELLVLNGDKQPLAGAQGVLSWSQTANGVYSHTTRSGENISTAEIGSISFSEVGQGEHTLQVRLKGYLPFSSTINITEQSQREEVVLTEAAPAE